MTSGTATQISSALEFAPLPTAVPCARLHAVHVRDDKAAQQARVSAGRRRDDLDRGLRVLREIGQVF